MWKTFFENENFLCIKTGKLHLEMQKNAFWNAKFSANFKKGEEKISYFLRTAAKPTKNSPKPTKNKGFYIYERLKTAFSFSKTRTF